MTSRHNQLNSFNIKLGGSISKLEDDRILQFQNENGKGRATSVDVGAKILYSEYDFELSEDFNFQLECNSEKRLYFIYVMEGEMDYSISGNSEKRQTVNELETLILACSNSDLKIFIAKNSRANFAIINVDLIEKENSFSDDDVNLNKNLFQEFNNDDSDKPFIFHCTFNLNIKEQLLQIEKMNQNGVVRRLLIKSFVHFVLALEILQHKKDVANKQTGSTWLTKSELKRIKNAIDAISAKPEYPYSISYLSRQYGIPTTKLQEGFKMLTGMTATNFVRKTRVEMAEKLIKQGNMNISEVVYSIGFTSRSYFSKIFKKRYNCSPKYYLENCRNTAEA